MSRHEVRVGSVLASTIYLFDSSKPPTAGQEQLTLTQLWKSPSGLEAQTDKPDLTDTNDVFGPLGFPWRNK